MSVAAVNADTAVAFSTPDGHFAFFTPRRATSLEEVVPMTMAWRPSPELLCPLREPSPLLSGPAPLRLSPPGEGELEAAEKHPRLRARDAAVHTLPEKPLLH